MRKSPTFTAMLFASGSLAFGSAPAKAQATTETRKSSLTPEQVERIKTILADASPTTYSFVYAKDGREVTRVGSASMRDLSTVKAYSRPGDTRQGFETVTVTDIIKTVWTSKFNQLYPDKVRQINAILEQSAR